MKLSPAVKRGNNNEVDLSYDELVLLIQLVNQRFVEMARKDPPDPATFETALFEKLYDASIG